MPPPRVRPVESPGAWARLYRRLLPVSAVYFCYNWILWLMLDWMPLYFMHSFHLNIKKAVISTSGVFIAGVFGDLVGGLISDKLLRRTGNLKLARSVLDIMYGPAAPQGTRIKLEVGYAAAQSRIEGAGHEQV